jgi:hypothetical protein
MRENVGLFLAGAITSRQKRIVGTNPKELAACMILAQGKECLAGHWESKGGCFSAREPVSIPLPASINSCSGHNSLEF